MTQCVYCESTSDLNTQLTVTLEDGNRVTVDICDAHAEEASVKTAREAYQDKQKKIEEVLAQAKALGIDLSQTTTSGLVVPQQQAPPPQTPTAPQPTPQVPTPIDDEMTEDSDDVVDTSRLDHRPGMTSVGGNTEMGQVSSHASHQVTGQQDKLDPSLLEGKAKMNLVEGREGMPIAIPEKRVDGTGTTRIKVANTENDNKLQNRFKKMAQDSMDDRVPNFARQGYQNTTTNCTFCRGEGTVSNAGKIIECPKCNGSGIISVY